MSMCKHCYEAFVPRSGKVMLYCRLLDNKPSSLANLCLCQRYCRDQQKYIPYQQSSGCKHFQS